MIASLLQEGPRARGFEVDIAAAALNVALRNAARHRVSKRATFVVADCFAAFREGETRFEMIVSNPPYVTVRDLPSLQREVRDHEPLVALTAGEDGLSMIRRLLNEAPAFLAAGGYLVLEIGYDQCAAVEQLIDFRMWNLIDIRQDLQGIPRIVALRLNSRMKRC